MRFVRGYVLVARVEHRHVLFGPGENTGLPMSIETTNFAVYEKRRDALVDMEMLCARPSIGEVRLARLSMSIAESEEELETMKKSRSLVVIVGKPELFELRGEHVRGICTAIPGSPLFDNGLVPFQMFTRANYTACEAHRQAQCPATIATFSLKRLSLT